jgi:hypothetical protein
VLLQDHKAPEVVVEAVDMVHLEFSKMVDLVVPVS